MIQKTQSEKEALKKAKQAFSNARQKERLGKVENSGKTSDPAMRFERYGVLNTEKELSDDFPVYWDYLYVIDDKVVSGMVIRSDIQGTIRDLKRDLRKRGYEFEKIYNCDIQSRKI